MTKKEHTAERIDLKVDRRSHSIAKTTGHRRRTRSAA
jgi:hypothetical protein